MYDSNEEKISDSNKEKVSPKVDLVFKNIFSNPENKDLLMAFLSSILSIPASEMTDVDVIDNELIPDALLSKFSRLDLLLTLKNTTKVNIEIQIQNYGDFKERTLYYWSKTYTGELQKSEGYITLKNVIAINIVDFNLFDCEEYHSTFRIYEENRHELLTDKLRIDFLELRKAKGVSSMDNKQVVDNKQIWMDFLNTNAADEKTLNHLAGISEIMKKAVGILRKMSADEKELRLIEQREKMIRDEQSAINYAKRQGIEEGREQGIEEGMEKGREQGIEEGMEKGMERERNMIIESMRRAGMSEEQIQRILLA